MGILYQTYFAPLQGFDLKADTINTFIANTALDFGKLVTPAHTTNYLSAATGTNLTGMYFLLQHVVADTDTYKRLFAYDQDIYQYQVYAGTDTAVGVLIPKRGAVVRTKWVSRPEGARAIAVDEKVNVAAGVFVTTADNSGTCGKVLNVGTDSKGNAYYDIILY